MNAQSEQINLFNIPVEPLKVENSLTPRQWKVYEFMKNTNKIKFKNEEERLNAYERYLLTEGFDDNKYSYNYFEEKLCGKHYSDMTSGRKFRADIQALKKDDTIQKVIMDSKIATTKEEAIEYLKAQKIKALKGLKLYWKQLEKLEKHYQQRLVFGQEREQIEALMAKGE